MTDTWTVVAAASGILGNITAVVVSVSSLRRADAALTQTREIADQNLASESDINGAMANLAWREQVFYLHERGLSPEQIRRIMLLEPGAEAWEPAVGRIEDILRDIPRQTPGQ